MTEVIQDPFGEVSTGPATPPGEIPRDGYGRMILPHPETGSPRWWFRPSKRAHALEDEYSLTKWKLRQAVRGIATRADLRALAAVAEWPLPKGRNPATDDYDRLAYKAMQAAGSDEKSGLGTADHKLLQRYCQDPANFVPPPGEPEFARVLELFQQVMADDDIHTEPSMIERSVINTRHKTAGTFDYGVWSPKWELPRIADVKTGERLDEYGQMAVAIQMWYYASSDRICPRYWDGRYEPVMPPFDQNVGVMIWIPRGRGFAQTVDVDLQLGRKYAEMIDDMYAGRNRKDYFIVRCSVGTDTRAVAAETTGTYGPTDADREAAAAREPDRLAAAAFIGEGIVPTVDPRAAATAPETKPDDDTSVSSTRKPRRSKAQMAAARAGCICETGKDGAPIDVKQDCPLRDQHATAFGYASASPEQAATDADATAEVSRPAFDHSELVPTSVEHGQARERARETGICQACGKPGHLDCGHTPPLWASGVVSVAPDAPDEAPVTAVQGAELAATIVYEAIDAAPDAGALAALYERYSHLQGVDWSYGQAHLQICEAIDGARSGAELAQVYESVTTALGADRWRQAHTDRGTARNLPPF